MKCIKAERKVLRGSQGTKSCMVMGWRIKTKLLYVFLATLAACLVGVYRATDDIGFSSVLAVRKYKQQEQDLLFHFIHTTNQASFHRRSLRAVESVFFHHPNSTVLIHVPDDGQTIALTSDMTDKPFLPLKNAGYKISVRKFQLRPLIEAAVSLEGSKVRRRSAEKWMNTQILKNFGGKNWPVDISDLVRLLLLYTQGGIYLDTDVIIINPLDSLPDSIGFERPDGPNNAVMKFSSPGNSFVADCINEYFTTFRSSTYSWGFVGPRLLRRVFQRRYQSCQAPDFVPGRRVSMVDPSCPVVFIWKDAFYPDIEDCLKSINDTVGRRELIKERSYIVHTYNTKMKQALKTVNVTKMMNEDTLCNWLYGSFCIFCAENAWT